MQLKNLVFIASALALGVLTACGGGGGSGGANSAPYVLNTATLQAAPALGTTSLISTSLPLEAVGYKSSEYFFEGSARSFTSASPLSVDGKWSLTAQDQADYKTRMVVYQPASAAKFNGTVIVEWLNVSFGSDTAVDWLMAHNELIRSGYAWVGVSAQAAGVEALVRADKTRYGTLSHPGDSFSYDIFSQAAKAILKPQGINPLAGLVPTKLIASGESQSANRMLNYANAFGANQLFAQLFDGFFIHSRTYASAPLSQAPQTVLATPNGLTLRNDLPVPTLMLQTEWDVSAGATALARQADTDKFRLWEVAGTSHVDNYVFAGMSDLGTDPNVANVVESNTLLNCSAPVNSGPQHFVVSAAFSALRRWAVEGTLPSIAPYIAVTGSPLRLQVDANGNVLGGIRTPYVDAPTATLSPNGQSADGFCRLFGTTKLFTQAALAQLYTNHDDYVTKVSASANAALAKGFLLPADAALINTAAQASTIGNP